ncbi:MAG: geranylgeranylglycerol-phosphate geranylgeranyltransferase [Acidilobaceae archaeon]
MKRVSANISPTLLGIVELCRPVNSLMGVFAIFVGIAVASSRAPLFLPLDQTVFHLVGGLLLAFSIMALNDVIDYEIDRINAPWRPIPSGRVSREFAWLLGAFSATAGLAVSFLIEPAPRVAALALVVLILSHSYNIYFKRVPLVGNVIVAWITALPLVYGGLITSHYLGLESVNWTRLSLIWVMAFATVLGREVVKSVADVEGDRARGAYTIAVLLGARRAVYLALLFYLVALVAGIAIALVGSVRLAIYLPLLAVISAIALWDSVKLLKNPEPGVALAHKNRLLYLMLLALVAVYVSSV